MWRVALFGLFVADETMESVGNFLKGKRALNGCFQDLEYEQ